LGHHQHITHEPVKQAPPVKPHYLTPDLNACLMNKKNLNILMLEDDSFDAELVKEQLLHLDEYNCIITWVKDKASYLKSLETLYPDIILSDYNLLDFNGIDALYILEEKKLLVPFIFVTGALDEETAVSTIKAGAWDYLVKDRLVRLPLAIRGALQLREQKMNILQAELQTRKLMKALEQSPVLIVVMNVDLEIEYVNKAFTETTGYTLEDLSEKESWRRILEKLPDEYFNYLQNKTTSPINWHGEIQSRKKNGVLYWESVSISPVVNEGGLITHYVIVKEDISPRKRMVQELIQARNKAERSDKLKDAFLQNLSHEIRTPLNAIVGFSSLLNEATGFPGSLKEYTSIILNSSNQLLSIVNDILTISRIQTGQEIVSTGDVFINNVLNELFLIFKSQAQKKNIAFTMNKEVADRDFIIITDETKLVQMLTNLLNNAFKYTHEGSITCGYTLMDNKIEFYVTDTGIGIAPENHKVIFDRFRQADISFARSYGGTGLGLSISKSFAELLGGTIWVESALGKGSTFRLQLPCQYVYSHPQQNNPEEPEYLNKEITILVAEDEVYNARLIATYLNDACITLLTASNGKEAVDMYKNHKSIDLILMDIKMPVMDGISAMLEIRKTTSIPIIAQTAYALESERQQLLKIGFTDYIPKPIKKENLLEKVIKWTHQDVIK
jgi:PAS domain S-box-containing protein